MLDDHSGPVAGPTPRITIPNKLFFRIGEVSQLLELEAHVLRYWESEFPGLSPKKSASGQRMFRRKDVELLVEIKHLLYEKKFTIEGARKALQERKGSADVVSKISLRHPEPVPSQNPMQYVRQELSDILKLLN